MKIETLYNHIVYLDKQRKMLKKNKFFKFEDVILKIEKQTIDKDKSLCENCYFNIHQISVSYTHLDVYKRQIKIRIMCIKSPVSRIYI